MTRLVIKKGRISLELLLFGLLGLPYYDDLELELPVDYVEDYTLEERVGTVARPPPPQQKKKPLQDRLPATNGEAQELLLLLWKSVIFLKDR